MSTPLVEHLDRCTVNFEDPQARFETIEGSVITVQGHRLQLENFLGYPDSAKSSWDLEHCVLGYRASALHLVVPNQASAGAAWIPLAKITQREPEARIALHNLIVMSRIILHRGLPLGEYDDQPS